jgi:hypothetical protein
VRPDVPHQITLGEAMAALKAARRRTSLPVVTSVDVDQAVVELQALRLCAICGWSQRSHEGSLRPETCGSYSPS